MTTYSYEFANEIAANVRDLRTKTPREQAYRVSPTLTMLNKKSVKLQGHYIEADVEFTGTALGGPFAEDSQLPTGHLKSLDRAQYEPAFYGEPVRMSYIKEQKCGGSRAYFNEWARRIRQAEKRQLTQLATHLFATTQQTGFDGANGIAGIPLVLPTDETTGTLGGLSRATYDWWRHYSDTSIGSYVSNGVDAMDLASLAVQQETGRKVSFYVTTKEVFQKMKKLARTNNNEFDYMYDGPYKDRLTDAGIEHISFEGVPVIHDPYAASGIVYGIDCETLYLGIYDDQSYSEVVPLNGAGVQGKVMHVLWGGQVICVEPRASLQLSGLS